MTFTSAEHVRRMRKKIAKWWRHKVFMWNWETFEWRITGSDNVMAYPFMIHMTLLGGRERIQTGFMEGKDFKNLMMDEYNTFSDALTKRVKRRDHKKKRREKWTEEQNFEFEKRIRTFNHYYREKEHFAELSRAEEHPNFKERQ